MGRSGTYNVIGQTAIITSQDKKFRRIYPANNQVEMEQQRAKARRDGKPITCWYSQTKTGNRILGDAFGWVTDDKAPKVKLVTCPICEGLGRNGAYYCPVCDGSGICKRGNERKWQTWQVAEMKLEYQTHSSSALTDRQAE